MNKIIVIFGLFLIFGCNNKRETNASERTIKLHNQLLTERQVRSIVNNLNHIRDSIHAYKLIDTLILSNGNTGFINFEKGIIQFRYSNFANAIEDFENAKKLDYDKKKCQEMISITQSLMNGKNK